MVLASTDPLILSLTWTGLALAAAGYGLVVRRRVVLGTPEPIEEDAAILRHLVQTLVINDQPTTNTETMPRP